MSDREPDGIERSEQDRGRRYTWELESRERAWRRELDRTSQQRKWDYDRQRQDATSELDRQKHDIRGDLDHRGGSAGSQGILPGQAQRYQEMDDIALRVGVYVAAALAVVAMVVLSAGHLAALAFSGGLPSYRAGDVPGILARVVGNPGDPGAAWDPVNTGAEMPGPLGWWAVFAVLVLVLGALALLVYALHSTNPQAQAPRRPRSQWARLSAHPELRIHAGEEGRVVVGTSGRTKQAIERFHSLLVVGPAHTGKTSGVAIPALLQWPGPALVASTKGHLMNETIGWRSHQGDVHVFDPAAVTQYHRSGWRLLSYCGTWHGAIRSAQHLTAAAQAVRAGSEAATTTGDPGASGQLWTSAMAMALAPFLYAAAADGRRIMDVAQWIEREERDEVLAILQRIDKTAAHAHETTFFRSDPTRSSFFHLMYQILSVYGDPTVAASEAKDEIVASELLDGGRHTLYLTAPEHDQARFQPLFAAMVREVLAAVSDRFASERTPLDPPLLLLLDEAVGVASVEDLASIASSGAPKGVQVVSIFQDLGRFDGLHANAAGLLAKSHRAMLITAGEHDLPAGEMSIERQQWAELGAQLSPGDAALICGNGKPVRLSLRRWYRDAELSRLVDTAQDAVAPSERRLPSVYRSPIDTAPAFSLARQTRAWLHSRRTGDDAVTGERAPAGQRGDSRYAELFELPEEEAPPDNVTQLPDPRDRSRR
ncbi:MAG: type IV secretory system conjugative DNA transfer family protein [Acidimicrobiales bacterium]